MRKIKMGVMFVVALLIVASCSDKTVQEVYAYGIYSYHSSGGMESLSDMAVIENYLNEKGLIIKSKIIEAESTSVADNQAIALYDQNVAKINEAELAELVKGRTSFKYSLVKATDDNPYLKEKEFKFNQSEE